MQVEGSRKALKLSAADKKVVAKIRRIVAGLDSNLPPKEYGEQFVRALISDSGSFKRRHEGHVDLFCNLFQESDRGCVLVAAAILDEELEGLLRDFFAMRAVGTQKEVNFFFSDGPVPPLRSTSLKIRLAFVLGLIDRPLKNGLSQLQDLRSKVAAHSKKRLILRVGHTSKIFDSLLETKSASKEEAESHPEKTHLVISDGFPGDAPGMSPKVAFTVAAMAMLGSLEDARKSLKRRRRQTGGASK